MSANPEKVEELRKNAELLAKQALETAELGIRFVRGQFESQMAQNPQAQDVQATMRNTAFGVESKAKEMFNLATHFMQELNDKWQPGTPEAGAPTSEPRPKPEKINIDVD